MKILVTHAYAKDNKGDAAILSVILKQLSRAFKKSKITVSVFDDPKKYNTFEGYRVIPSFMYLCVFKFKNMVIKLLFTVVIVFSTLIWAIVYRLFGKSLLWIIPPSAQVITKEIQKSDLIVLIGGGYIRAKKGLLEDVNIALLLHPIVLALLLKKPIVLYSQSIGPLATPFQKFITKLVLNRVQLIMAREDHTVSTLRKIGVKDSLVLRTVDGGFLFQSKSKLLLSSLVPKDKLKNRTIVGITVRKWMSKNKQAIYEKEIARFIDHTTKSPKFLFVFIPQVSSALHHDDDREIARNIVKLIKNKNQVISLEEIYSHDEVKSLYSQLDVLVGTRFHSVIFSLISGVPALAIEYEYKTSGIMKDLELSDWVIPIENVTAKILVNKFENLIKERSRYQDVLRKNLPSYIKRAEGNADLIKSTYEKYK